MFALQVENGETFPYGNNTNRFAIKNKQWILNYKIQKLIYVILGDR